MFSVAPSARISPLADVERSVLDTDIVIAEDAVIDSFVKIKPVGGRGPFVLGARSYINSGTVIYTGHGVRIGCDVLVAANCTFAPVNHAYDSRDKPIRLQGFRPSKGGIVVEDDVWIGAGVVLLDGARVGQGAIVAAGAVVREALGAYGIYGGNPAKLIRARP